jgi:CheY-like chemotaxis protein
VSIARTGFEAIVKASCHVPDLILLDDSLQQGDIEMSEVSRLLTTCPMTSHIPIVCLGRRNRMPQRLLSDLRRRVAV